MKSSSGFCVSFFITYVFTLTQVLAIRKDTVRQVKCPVNANIVPCTCHRSLFGFAEIRCSRQNVTQTTVNRVSSALWETNKNVSDQKYLYFSRFTVQETLLEEFDLLPLTRMVITWLKISNNPQLSNIVFSGNASVPDNFIKVADLHLENNSLTDAGLAQAFAPLHLDELWNLHLSHNLIVGSEGNGEFIKGLSAFPNLIRLNLTDNKISRVVGGQFKEFPILLELILDQNPIIEVGEDGLLWHNTAIYTSREFNTIRLIGCGLNDSKFSGKSGIERNQNSTAIKLVLWANDFETVSEDKFGSFLAANPKNEVEFEKPPIELNCQPTREQWNKCKDYGKNPIVCDEKLKWLKRDQSILSRVGTVTCKNDPGQTIRTTMLV